MAARLFRRVYHLLLRGVRLAKAEVGADGVVEEVHVLEHHGQVGQQAVTGELPQVVPTHGDAAGLGVVEPGQQAANGGLTGAGWADDGGGGVLRDGEAHVLQHRAAVVAEGHVLEGDVVVLQRHVLAVGVDEVLALQGVQLVHGVVDDAQGVGAVADGFQAGKDAEGEEHEHQHHRKPHLTSQAHQPSRQRQPHAAAFQRQQVQGVAGEIAPLNF